MLPLWHLANTHVSTLFTDAEHEEMQSVVAEWKTHHNIVEWKDAVLAVFRFARKELELENEALSGKGRRVG